MELSVVSVFKQNGSEAEVTRRSAEYHPSIWGDRFLAYRDNSLDMDIRTKERFEELKERVRSKVVNLPDSTHHLNFIDIIQRLGVEHHFKDDIAKSLEKVYDTIYQNNLYKDIDNLYTVSLMFRLLRQQGYHVSCDMFAQFMESTRKYDKTLASDARGLMSLYEAAHFRLRGEDILDEAFHYSKNCLIDELPNFRSPIKEQVIYALTQPIRTGLTRLEARAYIHFYEKDDTHDKFLLEFAKLDFNILQKMHQKEMGEITGWWKELDFRTKLPFARDRVVECYFWILGVYYEPEYAFARMTLTKVIALASTLDDIYDNYGTFEELELFTDAIERWDICAMDQLPQYMRFAYQALIDIYDMIEIENNRINGKSNCAHYAILAMKKLVRAYFCEAKWYHKNYVPTFEEYMENGLISSGYAMLATTCFVVDDNISGTKEAIEWISTDPLVSRASSLIARLMDDMISHKFEQKRGHVASAVECYMAQNGVSEGQTILELKKMVSDAWKDINKECLIPTKVPRPLLLRNDNLARVIDVLYKDEDGYTNSGSKVKGFIGSILIDSVPI